MTEADPPDGMPEAIRKSLRGAQIQPGPSSNQHRIVRSASRDDSTIDGLLVITEPATASGALVELDVVGWLNGRAGAPQVTASARGRNGSEWRVFALPEGAQPVSSGRHGVDPNVVSERLAKVLQSLHTLPAADCPTDASTRRLHELARHRVGQGQVGVTTTGPYRDIDPERLLAITDDQFGSLRAVDSAVVHANLDLDNVWISPDETIVFTDWSAAGRGDPHRDLAVVAASLSEVYGPALVAPFLDTYGLETVDLRVLDLHQTLRHLTTAGAG